jgi:hypothetical protein
MEVKVSELLEQRDAPLVIIAGVGSLVDLKGYVLAHQRTEELELGPSNMATHASYDPERTLTSAAVTTKAIATSPSAATMCWFEGTVPIRCMLRRPPGRRPSEPTT